ncbi:DUF397 domain-containing protein [Frankia sp. R82]|uniref:DUF397 domain-containing protein n=1 Tax=Frankia sp. R82 TaxID=2950553 RepID=UPI00204310C4|nr:DUF397 domain-containing protein [Frankia sp. R82]MCM3883068.1 DUF397 domain-containing protein [Frankia sp. R82]
MTTKTFRKSTASGPDGGNCVEVFPGADVVEVRDSKDRDGPVAAFTPTAWAALCTALLAGDPTDTIRPLADGGAQIRQGPTALTFTRSEWDAFLTGVGNGEFDQLQESRHTSPHLAPATR